VRARAATVRHTPLLREQELTGALDTLDLSGEAARLFHLRMPGGEGRADVFLRVTVWMDELWRAFRDERTQIGSVVVVTHGVALLMIRGRWMHWNLTRLQTARRPARGDLQAPPAPRTPVSAAAMCPVGTIESKTLRTMPAPSMT